MENIKGEQLTGKEEALTSVFDGEKRVGITKNKLESIPEADNVCGLINIIGKIHVADIAKTSQKFEVGEEVYQLDDGRVAKIEIPFSKGIEITD